MSIQLWEQYSRSRSMTWNLLDHAGWLMDGDHHLDIAALKRHNLPPKDQQQLTADAGKVWQIQAIMARPRHGIPLKAIQPNGVGYEAHSRLPTYQTRTRSTSAQAKYEYITMNQVFNYRYSTPPLLAHSCTALYKQLASRESREPPGKCLLTPSQKRAFNILTLFLLGNHVFPNSVPPFQRSSSSSSSRWDDQTLWRSRKWVPNFHFICIYLLYIHTYY